MTTEDKAQVKAGEVPEGPLLRLLDQIGHMTGYYIVSPPTPDYELVKVTNGDMRKLCELYEEMQLARIALAASPQAPGVEE